MFEKYEKVVNSEFQKRLNIKILLYKDRDMMQEPIKSSASENVLPAADVREINVPSPQNNNIKKLTTASPFFLFTKTFDKNLSRILLHYHSSVSAAANSRYRIIDLHHLTLKIIYNLNMPKFEKGNTRGYPAKSVPHNKGLKTKKEPTIPVPYKRLSEELDHLVRDPPCAAEKEEMNLRPRLPHFLRPRTLKNKGKDECWNVQESDR